MSIIEVENAVKLLRNNEVVAIPTETVYGLAANALSDDAVAKIYALKTRPQFNPLIIHVANLEAAEKLVIFNETAHELARKHWAGGLSLVLPKRDKSAFMLASAGLDTIAIRVPNHAIAQKILQESELPLAAPSANISGRLSPTTAEHVALNFPDLPVVDGGNCEVGLESTIIGFDAGQPVLLRAGVLQIPEAHTTQHTSHITSPGQLLKHYAPKNPIRINVTEPREDETYLGFGNMPASLNLSETGDMRVAAANLFRHLIALDAYNRPIAVAPIPNIGIGIAINDRLSRACN